MYKILEIVYLKSFQLERSSGNNFVGERNGAHFCSIGFTNLEHVKPLL